MIRSLLLIILIITGIQNCYSSHATGADVTYRHVKNMEYEVTVVFYRECRGIPINYPMSLEIYNDSFATFTSLTRIKIEDILTLCPAKPCTPSNTATSNPGIEAHYYSDTVDFNSGNLKKFISKKYCNVSFALSSCCRITMNNGNMFVEAMLNLCLAIKSPVNSPQFLNPALSYVTCNQTLSYTFFSNNYFSGDSVSYEFVKLKTDSNTYESYPANYSEKLPMTPLCNPPGSFNCTPMTNTNPVRGISFNSKTGNFLFTPTNCSEIENIACQVNVFRKENGKFRLAGYSKREMRVVVLTSGINKPTLNTYKDYTIRARENVCFDIKIKDDTTKTNKDTVKLIIRKFPKYGTLTLTDSNAREKTLHFCWNVSDSDYLKKKEDMISIYAYDRPCLLNQNMSTTINFKVIAPDSLTKIIIKTYYDKNKNDKKDAGEPYRSAPVLSGIKLAQSHLQTDSNGTLLLKPVYGRFTIGINRSQFVYATIKDTTLNTKFDSIYVVHLGFNYRQGIKGKVFEDINNNCVFDGNDLPLKGIKITAKNGNAAAFTDANGDYLFNNVTGTYLLGIDSTSPYKGFCNSTRNGNIVVDSQFMNFNFPLKKKTGFIDLSISLNPQTHNRNNAKVTQQIILENRGQVRTGKMTVKLLPSKKSFQFTSPSASTMNKDTIFFTVDSVSKGARKTIDFSHYIMNDSFNNGDQITYQLFTDLRDSVQSNNYYEMVETIDNLPCCKTEKVAYVPPAYYPIFKGITYRLNFIPLVTSNRALITDTIDDKVFDLRSLRFIGNNANNTVWLNRNILNIEFKQTTPIINAEFIYTIDLKPSITDNFTVYNKAHCNFDNQVLMQTNTVATRIISPFLYDTLSKNIFCSNEIIRLGFMTTYKPFPGNRFRVYLSDSLGNFSQQSLLLDTTSSSVYNQLNITLPKTQKVNTYKIKVAGTNPALEAFSNVKVPAFSIHPLPLINFNTSLNNGRICENDTLKLNAFGSVSYQLLKNGNPVNNFSADSVFFEKIKSNTDYNIRFRSSVGCINTTPLIKVTTFPLPIVNLSSNDLVLCQGEILTLQFSGALTYNLYRNINSNVAQGITMSPFQLTPPLNQSKYTLVGTDANGCRDTSNGINVLVIPLPAKPVITKINKALRSGYSFNNQWYNLSGKIDSATNQFFYPPVNGRYYVRHKDNNNCESTSDTFDFNPSGMITIKNKETFSIYPNPATQLLSITNMDGGSYSFDLLDTYGRSILSGISEDQLNTIRLETLSAGNYYLRIRASSGTWNFTVVIIH